MADTTPPTPRTYAAQETAVKQFLQTHGVQPTPATEQGIVVAFADAQAPTFKTLVAAFADLFGADDVKTFLPDALQDGLDDIRLALLALQPAGDDGEYVFLATLTYGTAAGLKPEGEAEADEPAFAIQSISLTVAAHKTKRGVALSAELSADQVTLFGVLLDLNVTIQLPSLLLTAELAGGAAPSRALLDKIPLPGAVADASIVDLRITAALRLRSISLHLAVANLLQFEQLTISAVAVDAVYAPGRGLLGSVWTTVQIPYGNGRTIDLLLRGEKDDLGWSFFGGVTPGDGDDAVPLGLLVADLAAAFGAPAAEVPDFLNDVGVESVTMTVAMGQTGSEFSFGCALRYDIDESNAIRLALLIDVKKVGGAYRQTLRGTARFADQVFALQFSREKQDNLLVAAYRPEAGASLALNDLVAPFAPDVAADLPQVTLALNHVFFAYARSQQQSAWLFGLALALDLDLTRIPLVGSQLRRFRPLGISNLHALYARQPFSARQVGGINSALGGLQITPGLPAPRGSSPTDGGSNQKKARPALGAGFGVGATLNLPGKQFSLVAGTAKAGMKSKTGRSGSKGKPAAAQPAGGPASAPAPTGPPTAPAAQGGLWVEVGTKIGPLRLAKLGARMSDGRVWLLLNGSLVAGPVTLSVYGMGVGFQLSGSLEPEFTLDGLGLAYSSGPLTLEGAFLKSEAPVYDEEGNITDETMTQYAGIVKIQAKAFSIMAVGAYGQLPDGSPSIFIYGALSAENGAGIKIGPLSITGLALGLGVNRRVIVPTIDQVSTFPMVTMVMGSSEGGGKAVAKTEDPLQVLAAMSAVLPPQQGQFFGALGVRFSLFESLDCFGLLIVQGGRSLEITLIGVARFRRPPVGKALCSIELDLLLTIKPESGIFQLEARLANSWVLDEDCQITGGFALYLWAGGEHAGDFVLTLGGYHPRFQKPAHYPSVDLLGLNWQVSSDLVIKGGIYFAITTSAFMAGGRLEASYDDGDVVAHFIAHVDLLMQWKPIHYDLEAGISVRVSSSGLIPFHAALSADIHIEGPPLHGTASLSIGPIDVSIAFGDTSTAPALIESWAEFGRTFLDRLDQDGQAADADDAGLTGKWALPAGDQPVAGPDLLRFAVLSGQITAPDGAEQKDDAAEKQPEIWRVRGDEVAFAFSAVVPITRLAIGTATPQGLPLPDGWRGSALDDGGSLTVSRALSLATESRAIGGSRTAPSIRPMGKATLQSATRLAIIPDEASAIAVDLATWRVEEARTQVPAALWGFPLNEGEPPEPSAEMVPDCLMGVQRLKPPPGRVGPSPGTVHARDLGWDDLDHRPLALSNAEQPAPAPGAAVKDAFTPQTAAARRNIAAALIDAGFAEAASFRVGDAPPRPLRAVPLRGRANTAEAG